MTNPEQDHLFTLQPDCSSTRSQSRGWQESVIDWLKNRRLSLKNPLKPNRSMIIANRLETDEGIFTVICYDPNLSRNNNKATDQRVVGIFHMLVEQMGSWSKKPTEAKPIHDNSKQARGRRRFDSQKLPSQPIEERQRFVIVRNVKPAIEIPSIPIGCSPSTTVESNPQADLLPINKGPEISQEILVPPINLTLIPEQLGWLREKVDISLYWYPEKDGKPGYYFGAILQTKEIEKAHKSLNQKQQSKIESMIHNCIPSIIKPDGDINHRFSPLTGCNTNEVPIYSIGNHASLRGYFIRLGENNFVQVAACHKSKQIEVLRQLTTLPRNVLVEYCNTHGQHGKRG